MDISHRESLAGKSIPPHLLALAAGLTLTFIAYCGTVVFEFVIDDHRQIVENPDVRSWVFLPRYFTQSVWTSVNPDDPGNFYRPVFLLWLRSERVLFGLAPAGWHLSNILVHLLVTLLVYFLASKLAGDRLTGALAAAIFGVHPVHVESVAWASGVIDPLMSALFIASFLCYLRKRESAGQARGWAAASLFLYGVALLAKEPAAVLPLIVFAYEWIFSSATPHGPRPQFASERARKAIWSALPYLALTALYLMVRVFALKGFSHPNVPLAWSTMVCTWPLLFLFYLRLLLWPGGLSISYDIPYVTRAFSWEFALPLLGLALVCGVVWVWARRAAKHDIPGTSRKVSSVIAFACVWLILPILPALDLSVFGEGNFAHDRHLYLPSVGFAILVSLAITMPQLRVRADVAPGFPSALAQGGDPSTSLGVPERSRRERQSNRSPACAALKGGATLRAARIGLASALVVVLVPLTIRQSLFWATDLALLTRAADVAPNNLGHKIYLANVLVNRGMEREAMGLYQQVLARNPDFWLANYCLGLAYYKFGKFDQARQWLTRAISIYPYNWIEFLYLGLTDIRGGNLEEATAALRQALRLQPNGLGIHFALGMILKLEGNLHDAAEEFKAELAVNPGEQGATQQLTEIEGGGTGSSRTGPPVSK